jgi:Domain of unknown function (DUF1905)
MPSKRNLIGLLDCMPGRAQTPDHEISRHARTRGKTATGIEVPEDVVAGLGSGKRPRVCVTINGQTCRGTVGPMGGRFMLPVSAESRKSAGVAAGKEVDVDIELDDHPREVTSPQDCTPSTAIRTPDSSSRGSSYGHQLRLRAVHRRGQDRPDAAATYRQGGQHAARGPHPAVKEARSMTRRTAATQELMNGLFSKWVLFLLLIPSGFSETSPSAALGAMIGR